MFKIIGEPLVMPQKTAILACQTAMEQYLDYRPASAAEMAKGRTNEQLVYLLASQLKTTKVFLAPPYSAMDSQLKGDLIIHVGKKMALILQVKSTEKAANFFLEEKRSSFNGEGYPLPGVVVCNYETAFSRIKAIKELSQVCGLPVKQDVLDTIQMVRGSKLRNKPIPLGVVPKLDKIFTKEVIARITFLGLGQVENGKTLILY